MREKTIPLALGLAVAVGSWRFLWAQSLPLEPPRNAGMSITGAYEGWFRNPDGSFSLLLGYFNRNQKEVLDIPVGLNNRIEPDGPDRGQPTHFLPGRQWGVFVVTVPSDFGTQKITWTIVANGETTTIPAGLNPDYEVAPFVEASGNAPPVLRFEEDGPSVQGPQGLQVKRSAKLDSSLPLTVWVSDDGKLGKGSQINRNRPSPVSIRWTKYRGPGAVTFSEDQPAFQKLKATDPSFPVWGKFTTTARFSTAGGYVLHLQVNDLTGDGGAGFQCCWTNGFVDVSVQP